jgi:subtilisin family serine protease
VVRRIIGLVAALLVGAVPAVAAPGPAAAPEYWFAAWHVRQLWRDGARGQGVTIAEIDSGVNAALPELHGRVLRGRDFAHGGDGRTDNDLDPFGHGTAMASIMVARRGTLGITGLAPGARILPLAVPLNGTTEQGDRGKVAAAIRWAADHGADIISMSIGGKRYPRSADEPCPPHEQAAVNDALRRGAVVIAAAGNTGPRRNTVEEPGVCLGVLTVGAVDRAGHVARFSAREPYVALDAPGVDIPSLGRIAGQAFSGNGTSQAAALVSAAAALVWSRYPHLTGTQVVARLLATLDERRRRASPAYGFGLLDAHRAVTASVPADAPDPVAARAAPFLRRAAALHRGLGPPPPGAAASSSSTTFAAVSPSDGSSARTTVGVVLVVVGGLALLVLLLLRLPTFRGRSRRSASDHGG